MAAVAAERYLDVERAELRQVLAPDEASCLVGDLDGDGLQFRLELLRVVGTEVQFAGYEANSDVSLRTAFIAAVGSGQRGVGSQCGCHVASLLTPEPRDLSRVTVGSVPGRSRHLVQHLITVRHFPLPPAAGFAVGVYLRQRIV